MNKLIHDKLSALSAGLMLDARGTPEYMATFNTQIFMDILDGPIQDVRNCVLNSGEERWAVSTEDAREHGVRRARGDRLE